MDAPQELIITTFSNEQAANETLKAIKKWSKSADIKVIKAAVLVKDEKGKTSANQDQDVSTGEGTVFGAVVGGIIGLLGGPAGAVVGATAGAATGGATASVVNFGFSNDDLDAIRASLPPSSSALIVLLEHRWVEDLMKELNRRSNRVWHRPLPESYAQGVRES